MKTRIFILLLGISSPLGWAQPAPAGKGGTGIGYLPKNLPLPSTERITDAELRARQQADKSGGIAKVPVPKEEHDISKESEFIAFGQNSTLVPKGAVLFVPDRYRPNVKGELSGAFLVYQEFLTKYPALVSPFEVTIEQAIGKKPLDAARFDAAKRTGLIVIAVLNRNPISVVPYTAADANPSDAHR